MIQRKAATVIALGFAQIIAWGSAYYLPAVLAPAIAADLQIFPPTVFAAFSFALVLLALAGPTMGRAIDRHGGKPVLAATNLVFLRWALACSASRTPRPDFSSRGQSSASGWVAGCMTARLPLPRGCMDSRHATRSRASR